MSTPTVGLLAFGILAAICGMWCAVRFWRSTTGWGWLYLFGATMALSFALTIGIGYWSFRLGGGR